MMSNTIKRNCSHTERTDWLQITHVRNCSVYSVNSFKYTSWALRAVGTTVTPLRWALALFSETPSLHLSKEEHLGKGCLYFYSWKCKQNKTNKRYPLQCSSPIHRTDDERCLPSPSAMRSLLDIKLVVLSFARKLFNQLCG